MASGRLVHTDYNPPKVEDTETTVSMQVHDDVKLHQPKTLRIEGEDELLSNRK